ncbi:MAG: hypothetical protein IJJ04_04380 [Clostridia bacterium]|nr:hypothetical protein [Clostridia bacterium]
MGENKKIDFSTSAWFEPVGPVTFTVAGNEPEPYEKFTSTVDGLKKRFNSYLKTYNFAMFSNSKKVTDQLYSNFKKYVGKLPIKEITEREKLKRLLDIEKTIKYDNSQMEKLLNKIAGKYSKEMRDKKENAKLPRVIKNVNNKDNDKEIEKGLAKLLIFAGDCVTRQKEIAIDKTEKGKGVHDSSLAVDANVKDLIEVFDVKPYEKSSVSLFYNKFLKSNKVVVDAYTKKFNSETGKNLKNISKAVDHCEKAVSEIPNEVKVAIDTYNKDYIINHLVEHEYIRKDKKKILDVVHSLAMYINALSSLITILDAVIKYGRTEKRKKLISLYDPRVIENIRLLNEKLIEERLFYELSRQTLHDYWKPKKASE